jgi:hypothetical protein
MMTKKMRWVAGAVLLAVAAAACEQSLIQPDAPASLGKNGPTVPDSGSTMPDTASGEDTGYFGSGHYEPAPPPDTTNTPG